MGWRFMFTRTLSSWGRLLGLGRGAADEERRAWGRFTSDVQTVCHPASDPDGAGLPARVKDVSRGGIRLVVEGGPLEPGDLLSVVLPGAPGGETSTLLACVVRSEALPGGHWGLGCSFATRLSDEELLRFRGPCPGEA